MAVHVLNIPHVAYEEDLIEFLEDVVGKGTILSCKIILHSESARSKGFGFIDFKEKQVAILAVKLSTEEKLVFHNRVLTLSMNDKETLPQTPPELFTINRGKLSMGCFQALDNMLSMWSHTGSLIIDLNIYRRTLSLRLKRPDRVWMMEYKMEFFFIDISHLMAIQVNGKSNGFLLQVKETPPYLYCRRVVDLLVETGDPYVDMVEACLASNRLQTNDDDRWSWIRTTDFTPNVTGQSFAYVVELPESEAALLNDFLKRTGIHNPIARRLKVQPGEPYAYATDQIVVPLLNPSRYRILFEHLFKINSLVQYGKLSAATLNVKFFKLIKESSAPAVAFALQAFSTLEDVCYYPIQFVKEQLDIYKKRSQLPIFKLQRGTAWIHRLLVTPTKVYCLGPEVETTNRIIRQYENLSSHFLRVNFVDENCSPLTSAALISEVHTSRSEVFKRIINILNEGLFIGYRKYEFLAFSASQLREGQLWMYSPGTKTTPETVTADSIRAGMGDFSTIRNVAKCAARMGQSFSSSTETRKVLPLQVKRIRDITVETGSVSYCFSDGIGKISEDFARTIAADCGLPSGLVPSAFQIRYGGYKGVVARDPTASSSFKLYLRPSMHKFDSTHMSLDVLEWTKPLACHLNRQVISLLSTLGIQDSAFMKLQNQVVSKFERMLEDDILAQGILQESGAAAIALKMLEAGYTSKTEPFLKRLLCVFKDAQLNELRTKAKIPVANGRLLMGCLDETRTLNYGEVFVKYTVTSGTGERNEFVVSQKVFVAKNPCLHPGDIRVLQAVDVPELGHMVDCVVFPQRGPRPHPNECSGSDLDGDLYLVSWDDSLVPPTMDPPMDYTPPPLTLLDHPVKLEEIQEFFVNYMVNDNLGVIANAHVVHADKEKDKARNPKCLELAHLASMAVDFPKTGVPAVIPTALRPREYPDFMEKVDKTSYISHGILGQLYRAIKPKTEPCMVSLTEEEMRKCFDQDLMVPDYEKYVEDALVNKRLYDMRLIGLMNQFGIREEAEIVSGHVLAMSQLYVRRQMDALPKVRLAFEVLLKEARSWFQGTNGQKMDEEEEFAKASAWYHVTYNFAFLTEEYSHFSMVTKSRIHLLSFPWVMSSVLFNLKRKVNSARAGLREGSSEQQQKASPHNSASDAKTQVGSKKRHSCSPTDISRKRPRRRTGF